MSVSFVPASTQVCSKLALRSRANSEVLVSSACSRWRSVECHSARFPTHRSKGHTARIVSRMANGTDRSTPAQKSKPHDSPFGERDALLITNDDGLDPGGAMVLDLAREMVSRGHRVVVCAPGRNNSACGQKVTLGKSMRLRRHLDLETLYSSGTDRLSVFSIDEGSPADCVIVAIEPHMGLFAQLGMRPIMTLSGVNLGPNLGPDVIYSGTFAAARQAAMYGVPGMASSLASMGDRVNDADYAQSCLTAIAGAASLAESLLKILETNPPNPGRMSGHLPVGEKSRPHTFTSDVDLQAEFAAGNVVVNLNVPAGWTGQFASCRLDNVLYRGAVRFDQETLPSGDSDADSVTVKLCDGLLEEMGADLSDTRAVQSGRASVSTLSTWPPTHPLAVASGLIDIAFRPSETDLLPSWIVNYAKVPST
jgi:5'/3'-nucleotidase SurE